MRVKGEIVFPNNIRDFRIRKRLTQAQLGKMMDPPVVESTISKMENGERRLSNLQIANLATILDCKPDEIPVVTGPAHLIVLDDANEGTFIWNLMNSDQWVGHSDRKTEGTFLPVTNQQVVYTGPANANNDGKDCLMVHNTGGVTNVDTCTNGHPYVCECDGRAANPASF